MASSLPSPVGAASSNMKTPTSGSSRSEVVERYRRMRKQRTASPRVISDENYEPTSSVSRASTPSSSRRSSPFTSPLSPKNSTTPMAQQQKTFVKPTPPPLHSSTTPSSSSSSVTGSARRERLARHARLLGSRGGRSTTPRNSGASSVPGTPTSATTAPVASSNGKTLTARSTTTKTTPISNYYSYEKPSTKEKKPPKTPVPSSSGSVSSMDPNEVSRRVRERRQQGAKKLFILATSPSMDDTTASSNSDNLTPLERHLSSQKQEVHDCPSIMSDDVSTLTMSTLSSLARDKRKFSRDRRFSASKLYARATGSSSASEENNKTTRGRSPVRGRSPGRTPPRGSNSGVKRSVIPASTSHSTDDSSTPLSRRVSTIQKARKLARNRSLSRQRTPTAAASSSATKTAKPSSPSATRSVSSSSQRTPMSVESPISNSRPGSRAASMQKVKRNISLSRQRTPTTTEAASNSVSSQRTPMSVDESPSRAGSRAASMQRARRTLARTKPQGKVKVDTTAPPSNTQKSPPPVFVAREKVEARARQLSPAPQTRRNLDKRTARLKYHNEFAQQVMLTQQEIGRPPPQHLESENLHNRGTNGVSVFIRKRPIFDYETSAGDFDVVFTEGRDGHDAVVIHSCNMHADMRQKLVKPIIFPCSAAFDETYSNDALYMHVGKPLVRLAANGGFATLLTFGQTGSGKTHTITGMEERVSNDLFRMVNQNMKVEIQFVELAGKQVKDLLRGGGEDDVKLIDQADGSVLLLNATTETAHSPEELYNAILVGKASRATEATDKNDVSSRSHSVLQIKITNTKNEQQRGVLTLLDCAGSERKNDSMYHSRDRQKESTEINASLWALKECIRARANGGSNNSTTTVPYRSSNLTRILRESLERDDAQLCVIATVAPNAVDTEHSVETLKTVTQFAATSKGCAMMEELKPRLVTGEKKQIPLSPKSWNHSQLVNWLGKKRFLERDVPYYLTGKEVMRMSRIHIKNTFFGGENEQKADRMFIALRSENDRASRAQHEYRMSLSKAQKYEM